MKDILTEHCISQDSSITIKGTDCLTIYMFVVHGYDDTSSLKIVIHDASYDTDIYDEIVSDNVKDIRDFMNKSYPLTLKEIIKASVVSLKTMIIRKPL